MSDKYILKGHDPIPCDDLYEWGAWFETADRIVAKTQVGPLRVSTVFLGLNHNWGEGAPLLFETMIFDGDEDEYQTRCSTWAGAEGMHRDAVAIAKERVAKAKELLTGWET